MAFVNIDNRYSSALAMVAGVILTLTRPVLSNLVLCKPSEARKGTRWIRNNLWIGRPFDDSPRSCIEQLWTSALDRLGGPLLRGLRGQTHQRSKGLLRWRGEKAIRFYPFPNEAGESFQEETGKTSKEIKG